MNGIENDKSGRSRDIFKAFRIGMIIFVPLTTVTLYLTLTLTMR